MENQHRKITGYRELSESEIRAMNDIKMQGEVLGGLIDLMKSRADFDQRWVSIGQTNLQQGIMALIRAIARPTTFVFALLILAGCSTGLQERAYKNEHGVYIVSQSLVNDRVTAGQPHLTSEQACWKKHTSEEMTELRKDGEEHSWYYQCKSLAEYKPGEFMAVMDQPLATLYKGPLEAAIIGGGIGAGLALSGDTVTNQSSSSASARSKRGHHRR